MAVNWASLLTEEFSKLPDGYVRKHREDNNPSWLVGNEGHVESEDEFCSRLINVFQQNFNDGRSVFVAFKNLRLSLPVLAERLVYRIERENILGKKQFTRMFLHAYVYKAAHGTIFGTEIPYSELLRIFEQYDFKHCTSYSDRKLMRRFNEKIRIFRGSPHLNSESILNGLSWTLNKVEAIRFAQDQKYEQLTNIVVEAEIKKDDVLLFTNERNEEEVIVNPNKVKVIHTSWHPRQQPDLTQFGDGEIPEPSFGIS